MVKHNGFQLIRQITQLKMELLFGDARFMGDGTTDVVTGDIPTTKTLLTSDYLDIDRPDPTIYPRGMLLFNTRPSSWC